MSSRRLARVDHMTSLPMRYGVQALTEREKETLRLLVGRHDAKSIARSLGLSVHTINERLRDARRKLEVSSSREAARLLAEAERNGPNFLADKQFGVPQEAVNARNDGQANRRQSAAHRLAWFGGGMLIMSLIIVALIFSSAFRGGDALDAQWAQVSASSAAASSAPDPAGVSSARNWVALLDDQRWEESWRTAATQFKSQLSATQWASTIQSVRQPLGLVFARTFQYVTKTNSLPGAPTGEYEIVQFETNFARKRGAVETVVLARGNAGWKVAGYFIR